MAHPTASASGVLLKELLVFIVSNPPAPLWSALQMPN
jgi:hypothetical protein